MNIVIAAAKIYKIQPVSSINVPMRMNFDDSSYMQFCQDLDHYVLQILIQNADRSAELSFIDAERTEVIRTCLAKLRECVLQSSMPSSRRTRLLSMIGDFENELENKRASRSTITSLVSAIFMTPILFWASGAATTPYQLAFEMSQNVAEVENVESEHPKISHGAQQTLPPLVLIPPRTEPGEEIPF